MFYKCHCSLYYTWKPLYSPGPQGGYQGALPPMLPCVTLCPLIIKVQKQYIQNVILMFIRRRSNVVRAQGLVIGHFKKRDSSNHRTIAFPIFRKITYIFYERISISN